MEIQKITRSYDRTVELKRPDGTSIWLKHGASIEAQIRPEEAQELSSLFILLQEIVISEVGTAIKKEKDKVEGMFLKPATEVDDLSSLPKRI